MRSGIRTLGPCERAATALAVALLAVAFSGCGKGKVTCTSLTSAGVNMSWGQCSDGKDRSLDCAGPAGTGDQLRYECTCLESGVEGKKFRSADPLKLRFMRGTPESELGASYDTVNKECGWNLGPD